MPNKFEQIRTEEKENPPISEEISHPQEAGKKDASELEQFIQKAQSDVLLDMLSGRPGKMGIDDASKHDTEFAPKKMREIEEDSKKWVGNLPSVIKNLSYKEYVNFLRGSGRESEVVEEEEYLKTLQMLEEGLEKKDQKVEGLLRDRYVSQRLRSLLGATPKIEKEKTAEDPYKEIEERLLRAKEELEKNGLVDDAKNLEKTIRRIQKDIANNEDQGDILLWDKETDIQPKKEKSSSFKLLDKIDKALLKIPFFGRYMSRDRTESVRDSGGTIIRADGTWEKFFTFTRFKKPGEKTHTDDLGGNDFHYIIEPQPGDEVVSWEPSKQGEKIIMEALLAGSKSGPEGSSLGDTGIEYWTVSDSTRNVKFENRKYSDPETNQTYSYAKLELSALARKGKK